MRLMQMKFKYKVLEKQRTNTKNALEMVYCITAGTLWVMTMFTSREMNYGIENNLTQLMWSLLGTIVWYYGQDETHPNKTYDPKTPKAPRICFVPVMLHPRTQGALSQT